MTTLEDLIKLADNWAQSTRHENMGMGSASGMMARSTDRAREVFQRGVSDIPLRELANALIRLSDHDAELKAKDIEMRKAMKDSIVGAIQNLHSGDNIVQVMLNWSREFYDEIMKAGEPDGGDTKQA